MRELKFRAWDKHARTMQTPAELDVMETCVGPIIPMWWKSEGSQAIFMQSTGLKDRNEKEIFEGDYLTSDTINIFFDCDIVETPCAVVWIDYLACLGVSLDGKVKPLSKILHRWKPSVFTVIGNIYEGVSP